MNKRTFIKTASILSMGSFMPLRMLGSATHAVAPADDDFWKQVRSGYAVRPDVINLENGYYCIQPTEILEKYFEHLKEVNRLGAFYMRTMQVQNKQKVVEQLAEVAGCNSDELIITRNTTESLDMIIAGQPWKAGDEAIMATHDYGSMLEMFRQVSERHGVVNKKLTLPLHPTSDEEIVDLYEKAITPKTRLLMVCHIINITGQVLPVRKICDMAHRHGVQVMVDGAHAFAHLNFRISDLNADYYGCSLHKWLSTPLGAGMLYVKKEHIPNVWPLFAEEAKGSYGIARLNHTGTIPVATDLTIPDAIAYYQKIGAERKEERLRYLQYYWTSQVRDMQHVNLYTPKEPERTCAIATVGVRNRKPADLAAYLLEQHKIYTVAIDKPDIQGVRVTPNIYNTPAELDALVKAIKLLG